MMTGKLFPHFPVRTVAVVGCAALAEPAHAAASPLAQFFEAGGPIIVILAALAVISLGVAIVKLVQFLRIGVGRHGFVAEVVKQLRVDHWKEALEGLEPRPSPVAKVMAAAVRGKADPMMDDTVVREEVTRVAQAQIDAMERGLALLSLIATIAPLLGLLGTVLGMIEAFQQMEGVGDRIEPAVLAGGIWEALLTTAAGLSVAIPAAVFFTWLQRSVDVEAQRMEDGATQVFTIPLYDAAAPVDSPAPSVEPQLAAQPA
jgi:biopolymer transport protein ExbB